MVLCLNFSQCRALRVGEDGETCDFGIKLAVRTIPSFFVLRVVIATTFVVLVERLFFLWFNRFEVRKSDTSLQGQQASRLEVKLVRILTEVLDSLSL